MTRGKGDPQKEREGINGRRAFWEFYLGSGEFLIQRGRLIKGAGVENKKSKRKGEQAKMDLSHLTTGNKELFPNWGKKSPNECNRLIKKTANVFQRKERALTFFTEWVTRK